MNKDRIKYFQIEFRLRVNDEKLYQPINKVFSQELKLFEPFINKQSDLEKLNKSLFLESIKQVNQDHQILFDKYQRAYDVIVNKNTEEIKFHHQLLISKKYEITQTYDQKMKNIQDERMHLKND
ncbi:MAG: hypothetical protein WCR19_03520, partial [Acholeplasmataceae bacterium]